MLHMINVGVLERELGLTSGSHEVRHGPINVSMILPFMVKPYWLGPMYMNA